MRSQSSRAPRAARALQSIRRPISVTEWLEPRRLLSVMLGPVPSPVTDNFNDGNDAGWTHYDPIAPFHEPPLPSTYELVDGRYRIAVVQPSPDPGALGPARAGSIREDATLTDFSASIDLIDWDVTLNQAFGILARVSTPGLGTTNGYALSYATNGDLDISLVTGEVPDDLDPAVDVVLDPANDYRLVFEGRGPNLVGKIFDLNDLTTPIATTRARDATYGSGTTGIFVYDNSSFASSTADATFDNFSAGVAGPADPTIAYWRFEEGQADQEFQPPSFEGGPDSGLAIDEADGDDPLRTFSDLTNPVYRSDVPSDTVTATGAPNTLSLDFTPNEDLYTARAGALSPHAFEQFTVETSFSADTITWMTIVGKDGKPVEALLVAPLQLKIRDDTDKLQIEIIDGAAQEKQVQSIDPIVAGRWYHAAAVSDGTTLSLYLDDTTVEGGYVLQGSVPVSGGLVNSDGTWSVGRGFFNNSAADWFDGRIDEVRISDVALDPSQFLFASASPRVSEVYVRGSTWTAVFKGHLEAQELGDDQYGYRVDNRPASDLVPWGNVDEVVLRFSAPPTGGGVPTPATVTLDGARSDYRVTSVTQVAGDPTTYVLRLERPLGNLPEGGENGDRIDLTVADAGPGGSDFRQRVTVLQGDVDKSGSVLANDYSAVKARFFQNTTTPNYTAFHDIDGSGSILANDYSTVKARFFDNLPVEPIPAATTPAALFGQTRVRAERIASAVLA